MKELCRITVLCLLAAPLIPKSVTAQQTDSLFPRRGAWGAEAIPISSGGAILRFASSHRAWVAGLDLSTAHASRPASTILSEAGSSSSYFRAQLGHRWYLDAVDDGGGHLRPTVGLGLTGAVSRNDYGDYFQHQWTGGGYVEGGVTWFFSPHFSLGAVSQLQATTGRERQSQTSVIINGATVQTTQTSSVWSVSANLTRVLGAVYF